MNETCGSPYESDPIAGAGSFQADLVGLETERSCDVLQFARYWFRSSPTDHW